MPCRLHPLEEAAVREALGDVHGEALLQEGHEAQNLRRVPAERAVFQRAVVRGEAEEFQRVEAVHPVGGVVVDHDLRLRRGARRAEDAGGIVRLVALRQARAASPRGSASEEFVLRVSLARRPPATRRTARAARARRRPSPRRRCPCDRRSAPDRAPPSSSTICFSLISRLNGHTTAPIRHTPSQISSFSRFSSDSSSTRLPLPMPRLLRWRRCRSRSGRARRT